MPKAPKTITTLADIQHDPLNANKHSEAGRAVHEVSMRQYGAGRSIVVDRDAVLIAGEQTTDVAVAIGLDSKPPIVVQTDGTQLVIVQRMDLSMADNPARAHGLALADNRAAQVSIDLSPAVILAYEAEGVPLAGLYSEAEQGQLARLAEAEAAALIVPDPAPQQEPMLKGERLVEIYCSAADLTEFHPVLTEWARRTSVTLNIS